MDDFVAAWTAGVLPLRRSHGFDIDAWITKDGRFVWIVRYAGPGTFEEADARYYASPQRRLLDPDPAQWIVDNVTVDLAPIATSG